MKIAHLPLLPFRLPEEVDVPGLERSLGLRSLDLREGPAAGGAEVQGRGRGVAAGYRSLMAALPHFESRVPHVLPRKRRWNSVLARIGTLCRYP